MMELISTLGLDTVILVLIVAIPSIISCISWGKKLWAKREAFKQENINEGKKIEASKEKKEERLKDDERCIKELQDAVIALKKMAEDQAKINARQ